MSAPCQASDRDPTKRLRVTPALDQLRPTLEAIPTEDLLAVCVKPRATALTARRVVVLVRPLGPRLAALLTDFDPGCLDVIEACARALQQTDAVIANAHRYPAKMRLDDVAARARKLRTTLIDSLRVATQREVIGPASRHTVKLTTQHTQIASDLLSLVLSYQTNQAALVGKTLVTSADLGEANRLAEELMDIVIERRIAASTTTRKRSAVGCSRCS